MLKILGFPNGSQAVLKRRINMIRVVTLLDLQSKQKWLDGDSSIIIVESGHEPRTEWRRSKIKNWHSTDIPRYLQGHTNKQNHVSVLFSKQDAYTPKEFLKFLLIICTRNAMNWPSFLEICFHR